MLSLFPMIRVSKWMQDRWPNLTQRQREEALNSGMVCLKTGHKVKKGDKIVSDEVLNCERLEAHLELLNKGCDVSGVQLIADEAGFVVVDKPAGVPTHPISLFDSETLTDWAKFHYPNVKIEFQDFQPTLTPHRLDTGTSGLVILATKKEEFLNWRERFKSKAVNKTYLAWCWGSPSEKEYLCEFSVAHAVGDIRKMVALKGATKYRPPVLEASSQIRVQERLEDQGIFLARVECSTGVTHQVRVHLATLGFPLVGDELYDPDYEKRPIKRSFHALRAISLCWNERTFSVDDKNFRKEFKK